MFQALFFKVLSTNQTHLNLQQVHEEGLPLAPTFQMRKLRLRSHFKTYPESYHSAHLGQDNRNSLLTGLPPTTCDSLSLNLLLTQWAP